MAIFEIQGPDGAIYEVDAPDEQSAIAGFQRMVGGERLKASGRGHNVPEYVPPGVEGYDPQTGEVARQPVGMFTSFMRGASDTASYGYGDEIGSYVGSAITGQDRDKVLSQMRQMQEHAQQDNPWTYMAGQVAGGTLQGLATMGAGIPATLFGRVVQGAGMGGAAGAAYGSGSGTDAESRAEGALRDGLIGGVMGGVFPLVAHGAGKAYEAGRNYLAARPIAEEAGTSPEALRMLGSVMDADGSLGPQGRAAMARAGDEAMLVDAGPNARAVLDTAIQRGGPGAVDARQAVEQRVARSASRLTGALDDALGTPEGIYASQRSIQDAARPSVNNAYQRAYNTPIDYATDAGRKVEDIIKRIPDRIAGRAVRDAVDQMIYDGVPNAQILANIADDGKVTFQAMPNVMQADYIKKALDRMVSDGTDPLTGKLSSEAVFASRMARDLRDALGEAVPAYREALSTAADPLSRQSAIRLGSKLLSSSMTRDQVAEAVKGMTEAERRALAQGVRSQIDDAMAQVTRTVSDGDMSAREAIKALRTMSSRANREKLALAIGEEPAANLFAELDQVATSFDLRASIADNSKTFARLATQENIRDITGQGGAWSTLKQGVPLNAAKRLTQAITGETPAAIRGREDRVYSELARLLTRPGGAGMQVYEGINRINSTDLATQLMRDRLVRLLSGPQTAYPATALTSNRLQGR